MNLFKSLIATLVMLAGCERSSPPQSEAADATGDNVVKRTGALAAAVPLAATPAPSAKPVYVCPMHPEVTSGAPGLCPKCNMKLEPKAKGAQLAASLEDASRRL